MPASRKYLTEEQALDKMQRYCAYQDRCHQEVRSKLIQLGVYGDQLERILYDLIQENFLNEERFARSYARGKFRIKKWGRTRIRQELRRRKISDYCIRAALSEIEENEYQQTLTAITLKKIDRLDGTQGFEQRAKVAKYLIGRGFESEQVWSVVKKLLPDDAS